MTSSSGRYSGCPTEWISKLQAIATEDRHCKSFHPVEKEFMAEVGTTLSKPVIGRILGRTSESIRIMFYKLKIKSTSIHGLTTKDLWHLLDMPKTTLLDEVNRGRLKSFSRAGGCKRSALLFHIDDVRKYIFEYQRSRSVHCLTCDDLITGDLYCAKHEPVYDSLKKPTLKKIEVAQGKDNTSLIKGVGKALRQRREFLGLNRRDIGGKLYRSISSLQLIENGKYVELDIDVVAQVANALGMSVKIIFEEIQL